MSAFRLYEPHELGRDGYPPAWHETVKHDVRDAAGHRCIRCQHPYRRGEHGNGEWSPCDRRCSHRGPSRLSYTADDGSAVVIAPHDLATEAGVVVGYGKRVESAWRILTVHHLDGCKANCRWWNLAALCQRDHLNMQTRVQMDRVWPWEHSRMVQAVCGWLLRLVVSRRRPHAGRNDDPPRRAARTRTAGRMSATATHVHTRLGHGARPSSGGTPCPTRPSRKTRPARRTSRTRPGRSTPRTSPAATSSRATRSSTRHPPTTAASSSTVALRSARHSRADRQPPEARS